MLPDVVVLSTVQPVIPVGADITRLLALTVSASSRRSPAETVVGVVTFGVDTLPRFTAPPTYDTVLGAGAPTTTFVEVTSSVADWLSVTTSVMSWLPGFSYTWFGVAPVSVSPSPKSHAKPSTVPSLSVEVVPSNRSRGSRT